MEINIKRVKGTADRVKINDNIFHKSVNYLPFTKVISITGHIYRKNETSCVIK